MTVANCDPLNYVHTGASKGNGGDAPSAQETVEINAKTAVMFVFLASAMLLLLYFFSSKILYILLVSRCLVSNVLVSLSAYVFCGHVSVCGCVGVWWGFESVGGKIGD